MLKFAVILSLLLKHDLFRNWELKNSNLKLMKVVFVSQATFLSYLVNTSKVYIPHLVMSSRALSNLK